MEDEHQFLFDCPAYGSIQASHASLFKCAHVLVQYQTFLIAVKQMHVVDLLGTVFLLAATFCLAEFA